MRIIFDKGLATERGIEVDRVSERPMTNRLTGSKSDFTENGAPDLSKFKTEDFVTVAVETGAGEVIELSGNYSKIADVSVTYEDEGRSYHVSIAVE